MWASHQTVRPSKAAFRDLAKDAAKMSIGSEMVIVGAMEKASGIHCES